MNTNIKIKSVEAGRVNGLIGAGPEYAYELIVRLEIPAKLWHSEYKIDFGGLVVDVNNLISNSLNFGAYNPTVNKQDRCKNGVKAVSFRYYFGDQATAIRLGIDVKEYYSRVHVSLNKIAPKLTLVHGGRAA